MSLITEQIPSMPQLNPQDIERILRNIREDLRMMSLGEKGAIVNVRDVSSAYTAIEDDDVFLCWGDTTISLPATGLETGKMFWVKDISSNQITVDASVQIDDATRQNLAANGAMNIVWDGSEYRIIGDK
jgi:hypothetical protein